MADVRDQAAFGLGRFSGSLCETNADRRQFCLSKNGSLRCALNQFCTQRRSVVGTAYVALLPCTYFSGVASRVVGALANHFVLAAGILVAEGPVHY